MLPNAAGTAGSLSGLNVAYKRKALGEIQHVFADGFFETFANEELAQRGHRLSMAPAAIVYHNKSYKLRPALSHCYHLARSFAARRALRMPDRRVLLILGSLTLPILLPARIVLSVAKKKRTLGWLAASMPFLILLMSFWSYGEFRGYLAGEGASRGEWR
jgi:GT2 family glycosyltransferase